MKRTIFTILVLVTIAAVIVLSCKKEYSCEACNVNNTNVTINTNHPPVSCAGQDQTIDLPLNSVMLDGTCSSDPDNNIKSYLWTKISGPSSFSVANAQAQKAEISNMVEGVFLFQLKVTDAAGLYSFDTVQVTVNNLTVYSQVDVYVAGQENQMAKYWKNGQEVVLNSQFDEAIATSIVVVNNDVYVAGYESDFTGRNNKAKYWKNGQEVFLTGGSVANCITVVGSDVYTAGWERNGSKKIAKYWKNGQAVALTNGLTIAEATCVTVAGGNVYVAGHENGVAKYWKNGQAVSLTDGSNQAYANCIVVVGSNIYVAGGEQAGAFFIAKYWKNGKVTSLSDVSQNAYSMSIAVIGSDIYVAGYEDGGPHIVAKYWKNGRAVLLTNSSANALATSIAILGGDVYVAGTDFDTNSFIARYWKNGQPTSLGGGNGAWATSIAIVPR
jgi:hypothetical protein